VIPETRYAYSGDVAIAYQVVGEGERDFVLVPNWINQVEHLWNEPSVARWLRRLGGFGRLILFDRRGTGLSERVVPSLALEDQMEDVRAVMDAAGSGRATIVTLTEGSLMSLLFAATQPERVEAIVLCSPIAAYQRNEDVTWTFSSAERDAWFDQLESAWGTGRMMLYLAPSLADDERFVRWFAQLERLTGTPASFRRLRRSDSVDIRPVLGSITVPTLVASRSGSRARGSSRCPATTPCRWPATPRRSWTRSRSSSRDRDPSASRTGSSPPSCSPTSSIPRGSPPSWATGAGATCSPPITTSSRARSAATADGW